MVSEKTFRAAFLGSIPVLLGYGTLGLAFGFLLTQYGYPWYLAPIMSLIIYAGAMQFLTLSLLLGPAGLLQIAFITLFVNLRHTVYGLSLLEKFKDTGKYKPYLVYALTDETFALLSCAKVSGAIDKRRYFFLTALLNQSYWVTATTAGALLGKIIIFNTTGLDFALTALFVVLALEQLLQNFSPIPLLIAAGCSISVLILAGPGYMLVLSLSSAIGLILLFRRRIIR